MLLAWILDFPLQSTTIDNGLEVCLVVGIGCRIIVVQPDGKSVVNKSLVEGKIFFEEWEDVCFLVDGNV